MELGYSEIYVGEVCVGDLDGNSEFVVDHTDGNISHFSTLEDIPHELVLRQLQGTVQVKQWGLST